VGGVQWLKSSVAMLLLALWVPVSMHCGLEALPGFNFLQCCCGGDEVPEPDHGCTPDTCSAIESGLYKIEDDPAILAGLATMLALAAWEVVTELPADSAPARFSGSAPPPELGHIWQFIFRAARPPRAPSFIS
jgi:hypothetical protein